jgi:hypothetical protein
MLWVDQQTLFVLASEQRFAGPNGATISDRVTSITYDRQLPDSIFALPATSPSANTAFVQRTPEPPGAATAAAAMTAGATAEAACLTASATSR